MLVLAHTLGAVLLPCAGFTGLIGLSLARERPLASIVTCVCASAVFGCSFTLLTL